MKKVVGLFQQPFFVWISHIIKVQYQFNFNPSSYRHSCEGRNLVLLKRSFNKTVCHNLRSHHGRCVTCHQQ